MSWFLTLLLLTLFTDQVPGLSSSTSAWELGVRLTTNQPGRITAIRFYKAFGESGLHVGHLWDASGRELAVVTFTGETASGWQEQALTSSGGATFTAGANFTVSVNHVAGSRFAVTLNGLATGITSGPLTAGPNSGRSGPPGVSPTTPSPHNYFRDVVFEPDTGPRISVAPVGTQGDAAVTLTATQPGTSTVQLFVDGIPLTGAVPMQAVVTWGLAGQVLGGSHVLTASLTDAAGLVTTSAPVTVTIPTVLPDRLVQPGDLVFQGAFKLPHGPIGASSFDYGGTVLAFNPAHGSLFIVGHPWQQDVAEISIPAVSPTNTTVASLPMTTVLQPFVDATEGQLAKVGDGQVQIGGLLAYQGALYLSAFVYYDGSGTQILSEYTTSLDFSVTGEVKGPFRVGVSEGAGYVDGYFGVIPPVWQATLGGPVLHGNCCLSIISRTSFGPAAYVIDPAQLGGVIPQPAIPLVFYPQAHPLDLWGSTSTLFNGSTQINAVIFPEGTRSVLFVGRHGTGTLCYGEGTADPALVGKTAPDGALYCFDPTDMSKGVHAFPYSHYIWAVDARDLAAVKRGERKPWEVKPYAIWPIAFPLSGGTHATGATYDPMSGRIFVVQDFSDGDNPIVNVFTLKP